MTYYKLLLAGCLMAFTLGAGAQDKTKTKTDASTTEKVVYIIDSTAVAKAKSAVEKDYDPGFHFMPEVKLGSCYGVAGFGVNLVLEREFHKYLAWDIASVDFSVPFKFNAANIGLKTGIRGFSPRFMDDRMRGFLSVAAGYDCNIKDKLIEYKEGWFPVIKKRPHHGLGLSCGIGIQFKENFFLGYTMEYSTAMKFTSHYGRFGYRF